MYKLILCLTVISCTTLIGNWFSERLRNRRRSIGTVIESISKMKTLINFGGYEIYPVVSKSFDTAEGFESFTAYPDGDTDFFTWWRGCVDHLDKSCALNQEDKDLLKRFAEGLGVSDTEGQISNCDLYRDLFTERLNKSKEAEEKKSRLYRVLGFSLGCMVTLLIL